MQHSRIGPLLTEVEFRISNLRHGLGQHLQRVSSQMIAVACDLAGYTMTRVIAIDADCRRVKIGTQDGERRARGSRPFFAL